MVWVIGVGVLVAIGAVLYGLHRLMLWAEGRGWVFYRNKEPKGGSMGNALLEIQSYLEPDKKHMIELRTEVRQEEKEAGDDPDP